MPVTPTDPVFISYRQTDGTDICSELAWLLRAAGIPVWRDRDDLPPGDTEQRLLQAMASGLSGAVFVVTPDVEKSEVLRFVESPELIRMNAEHQGEFVLGIANAIEREPGKLDYTAPDRLLAKRPGTLSGVDQTPATRLGLITLVGKIVFERVAAQRESIADNDSTFTLCVQTRNTPQVYDRTGAALDIRLRPGTHERLPSEHGLKDLADVIGLLPDAITRTAARRVQVSGGAHLSVAFTLGAAIPSTRVGHVEVVHQDGQVWASASTQHTGTEYVAAVEGDTNAAAASDLRPEVAVYVDLLPTRSDAAFGRFLDEHGGRLTAWAHLRSTSDGPLDPADAGLISAEAAQQIRMLSDTNGNALVHVLLRCPFPIAVLLGRLTNTLRSTVYEWDDSEPSVGDSRPTFRPTLDLRTSANGGVIERVHERVAGKT